ncbi:MAG TPA: hypothetical protein VEA63_14960, partial [Opitutus sp.]|nr:hypothetical protein [Opitutus sp.]
MSSAIILLQLAVLARTTLKRPLRITAFLLRVFVAFLAWNSCVSAVEGLPVMQTFGPRETGSSGFYWCTAQDERGVLYFGTDALLTFDGDRWSQYHVPGAHAIRAVAVDPRGRVWIGAVNEIGYFDRAATGGLSEYHSLVPYLSPTTAPLGNVWHAFVDEGRAIFVTADQVLVWDGKEFTANFLPGTRRLPAMQADGRIFVSHLTEGLFILEGKRLRLFTAAAAADERGVAWIKRDGDGWLMVTTRGLARLAGDKVFPLGDTAGDFITSNVLSSAASFPNGDICVGTLSGGLAVFSPDGALKQVLTSADGLQATSVHSVFVDRDGAAWVSS